MWRGIDDMKTFLNASLVMGLAFASVAFGQEQKDGIKHHVTKVVKTSDAPVTMSEARAVFDRAQKLMQTTLAMKAGGVSAIPTGDKPVTRTQVVTEMARLYNLVQPKVKLTPAPTAFDAKVVRLSDAKQKANLMTLIRMGAIAKVGPLATGPSDTLTVPQFGDAVGFFLSRMAYMTHMPSADWTASLKKD